MKKMKLSTFAKENDLTYRTVWNWCQKGKINFEQSKSGTYFVLIDDVSTKENKTAVYCRVSSSENKANLESQKQRCLDFCAAKGWTVKKTICEIGSGINDNREKLTALLTDDEITTIVVEHKDRLARFGTKFIEAILKKQGKNIFVINDADDNKEDLVQDFISIITSFCARIYGQRRCKRKTEKIIAELNNVTEQ